MNLRWLKPALALALLAPAAATAQTASLAGTLLVADRALPDPRFARSVVLMIGHDAGGAIGLVVNRPTGVRVAEVLPETAGQRLADALLYWGGPVEPRRLGLLGRDLAAGMALADGMHLILDAETFDATVAGDPSPARLRMLAGYAAWAPGQLESELQRGDWHILPAVADEVFDRDLAGLWQRLVERVDTPAPPAMPIQYAPRHPIVPDGHTPSCPTGPSASANSRTPATCRSGSRCPANSAAAA